MKFKVIKIIIIKSMELIQKLEYFFLHPKKTFIIVKSRFPEYIDSIRLILLMQEE